MQTLRSARACFSSGCVTVPGDDRVQALQDLSECKQARLAGGGREPLCAQSSHAATVEFRVQPIYAHVGVLDSNRLTSTRQVCIPIGLPPKASLHRAMCSSSPCKRLAVTLPCHVVSPLPPLLLAGKCHVKGVSVSFAEPWASPKCGRLQLQGVFHLRGTRHLMLKMLSSWQKQLSAALTSTVDDPDTASISAVLR